jgi:AcrR family transcriptional regulator
VAPELGLRERKKQRTRGLIFETAARLFAERGFDAVTVAEVARAADVSEVTVFNYFGSKEGLFFGGMEFFEERLLSAVRERAPGESVLAAFRRPVLDGFDGLAADERAAVIALVARLISGSPALRVRELEIVGRYTRQLADLLSQDEGASAATVEAAVVANALMGAHRALVEYVRGRVLAGRRGRPLAAEARSQAVRAFSRLESGLASYAIRST